ncbi:MAG TPA: aspartate kinase, partial [Chryseosolibacter sp.]|nr:aspartate kinase [Chryseosolibacter sp.]
MKVFKFGGASVKDPRGVKNVATILHLYAGQPLVLVISAMGKTTNALEKILSLARTATSWEAELAALKQYHFQIMSELFADNHKVWGEVEEIFKRIDSKLKKSWSPDQAYDQIVSEGEIISTTIVHRYLVEQKIDVEWLDARDYVITDNTYREAKIQWRETCNRIERVKSVLSKRLMALTQGFIGKTPDGFTT